QATPAPDPRRRRAPPLRHRRPRNHRAQRNGHSHLPPGVADPHHDRQGAQFREPLRSRHRSQHHDQPGAPGHRHPGRHRHCVLGTTTGRRTLTFIAALGEARFLTTGKTEMNILLKIATGVMLVSALAGCATTDRLANVGRAPALTPIVDPTVTAGYRPVTMPMPAAEPAVYQPNSLFRSDARGFFKDQRAGKVGDILTVVVTIDD